jgi:replication factor C subunit 3/5
VVQELIKEMASATTLESARSFKVVVLAEVHRLSKDAQAALRRTMEKYSGTCRLILCTSSPSQVIEPLRSRCLGIRVAAPSQQEVMAVLTHVCQKENLTLPTQLAARLSMASGRNLRRAVLMLEACKVTKYPFEPNMPIALMDWERFVGLLVADIVKEQSPAQLLQCRAKLYELLVNCIPADVIVKKLVSGLLERVQGPHETVKHEVLHWAAHYEQRLALGSKELFHLEALIARIMAVIKAAPGCVK